MSFLEIDQFSFSPGPHALTIVFNVTTGGEGEFQYNFFGQVRERKLTRFTFVLKLSSHILLGVVIELQSDEGLIDALEGEVAYRQILASGFSYGAIPVRVSILTYSEYAARGFNLSDEFDFDVIPPNAADGTLPILPNN